MKKLLIFLLAMCLLLTACGQTAPLQDSDTPATGGNTPQEMLDANSHIASALVILSVNPSFHILVMEDNITYEVLPNNADAEAVLGGNTFNGVPFNDTLSELLRLLQQGGYLHSDATVNFEVCSFSQTDSLSAITQTVEDSVNSFQTANSVSFHYSNSVSIMEEAQPSNTNTDDSRYQLIERDKDGNIIKTVEEKQDTILTLYYENGIKVREVGEATDGTSNYETVYAANGLPLSETGSNQEYTYETLYNANGNRLSESQSFFDGRATTMQYYSDGTRKAYFVTQPDGTRSEVTYYPSGATASERIYGNGGDNKYYFDERGNKTAYEGLDSNGWPVTGTYAADGSAIFTTKRPDGSIIISTVDANGNVLNQQVQ